jgi:transcriptional regulator with XRE-family HTH domain
MDLEKQASACQGRSERMPAKQPPTIRLRRLAAELRHLRAEANLTREEVEEQTNINQATLYRLETARVRPQVRTMTTLLDLYGVEQENRDQLLTLLREAGQRGWLQPYHSELPEMYGTFISFEAEAKQVMNYESLFVPGLLQTEDYARAVIRGVLPTATKDEAEMRVRARIDRQELLTREEPLKLWAIMDEAALRRVVGGRRVMKEQMRQLIEASEQPNITLQVIRFDDGAHPGMPGSFIVLRFDGPHSPDVVYIDSMAGDLFLEDEADVGRYSLVCEHLRAAALSPEASRSLFAAVAEGNRRGGTG